MGFGMGRERVERVLCWCCEWWEGGGMEGM